MKILVVGPAWVGDMVMSQALYIQLKKNYPTATIDVIAPLATHPLLQRMPEVNQAIPLPLGHGQFQLTARLQLGKQLQQQNYQWAILLPNSWKSALIPWRARIPKRTGWLGEMRWGLLNDIRHLDKTAYPKMVQRFVALGLDKQQQLPVQLPQPKLRLSSKEIDKALARLQLNPTDKPLLALCPGAEFGAAKQWPSQHYAALAKAKIAEGWQVWLFGGKGDIAIAEEIQQYSNHACVNLVGDTTLPEAIDLLSCAQVVVSNDSGLMHIAASLQIPLVVIYGSSDPRFTPPLTNNARNVSLKLDCSPCFQRTCPLQHMNCLNKLDPELVLQAITELRVTL